MDRIEDVNVEELNELIAREQANAQTAMWGDDDLTGRIDAQGYDTANPLGIYADKRMRNVVAYFDAPDGSWQPTALKQYDHVQVMGVIDAVVAMPARGREFFLAYAPEHYGTPASLVPMKWDTVTDRAPLDEHEQPMPINVLPPPEGEVTITTTIASHEHAATLTTSIDDEGIHTSINQTEPEEEPP